MITWDQYLHLMWLNALHVGAGVAICAAIYSGISWFRSRDENVWEEQDLTPDEDVSRIKEGFALASTEVAVIPSRHWTNADTGATAYLRLRELAEPQQVFYPTPVPATAVMTFDPQRPTGVAYQAYAPIGAHRLPDNPSSYQYPRLRSLVTETSQLSLGEIKDLVHA